MKRLIFIVVLIAFSSVLTAEDKKKPTYRKTQEVNFENQDIDGKVNSPDGAYLLQKRGVQFFPLFKVNNEFEKKILESVEYLR